MMNMERANRVAEIIAEISILEATPSEVRKGDEIVIGITVGETNSKIRPNIYIDEMDELTDMEIANKVIEIYDNNKPSQDFDNITDIYTDWNKVKSGLTICIRQKTSNEEDVKEPFLDMELYVRYVINTTGDTSASVVVKKAHAELWEVDEDTILSIAKENSESKYTINDMANVIEHLKNKDYQDLDNEITIEKAPMYVLSNTTKTHGASVILSNKLLNKIAEVNDENLYIIPSSIHEIIVVPVSIGEPDFLKEQIREVNETVVMPREVLSNNLYYYDADANEVRVA